MLPANCGRLNRPEWNQQPRKTIIFLVTTLRELCESDHALGYGFMKRVSKVIIKRLQSTRLKLLKQGQK